MGIWKHPLFYVLRLAICFSSVFCGHTRLEWSYSNIAAWRNDFPKCGGNRQSPIDIVDDTSVTVTKPAELHFNNYNVSIDVVELVNNGKTAKFDHLLSRNITLAGQGMYLHGNFSLAEVHFHWGDSVGTGSEHKINGKSSPLEVHFVHFNLEKYRNIGMAREKPDGVLVLSVLTEASKNATFNNVWKTIGDQLDFIHSPGSKTSFRNLLLQTIIPQNVGDYYMYKGSFTTPPCFQTVTWIVLKEKLQIFEEHLESFRAMQTSMNNTYQVLLLSNIRPVQPLNSRAVLRSFHSPGENRSHHVFNKVIDDNEVITTLMFHTCHLPLSVSISIIIPSLDINWKISNLTTDLPRDNEVLELDKSYGVTLEMHNHPRGLYKDNVHVTVQLKDSPKHKPVELIQEYFNLNKECLIASCKWLIHGMNRTCSQRLINSDDTLSFTMAQDACGNSYKLVMKKQNGIIFETTLRNNTGVVVKPMGVDKTLQASLSKWNLVLYVNRMSEVNSVKLFLEIPRNTLTHKVLVMEGDYGSAKSKCDSKDHHVNVIVGVAIGVFILAMVVLTVVLVFKRRKRRPQDNLLMDELQLDTAKV